jgi:hypothetical protein
MDDSFEFIVHPSDIDMRNLLESCAKRLYLLEVIVGLKKDIKIESSAIVIQKAYKRYKNLNWLRITKKIRDKQNSMQVQEQLSALWRRVNRLEKLRR